MNGCRAVERTVWPALRCLFGNPMVQVKIGIPLCRFLIYASLK